ncbi:carboxylesterase family protein [Acuticoccus kandeliae]|uniref:carboxylesterase family protein n=1 Tax=Acuticoccus kandeliae TaxID=2073160 RepID=UPI000D3EC009|nr:carboxylesterase family protein [Acuticoccus kandeliae]
MGGVLGAPHAVDFPIVFGTMDAAGATIGAGESDPAKALNMMSAFAASARTGNPNTDRLPAWAPYDAETRTSMLINATPTAARDWRGAAREALADLRIAPFNRAALYGYEAQEARAKSRMGYAFWRIGA